MKRVMIVDDEILVRVGMQSLINWQEHGYDIVGDASNGAEALEKIRQYRPDIVLTDLKMAPMDGFELIEQSRDEFPDIRFIILSSYNDFENVRRAMKLGAFDYIFKLTVKPEELLKVLKEASAQIKSTGERGTIDELTRKNLKVIKKELIKKLVTSNELFHVHMQELRKLPWRINFDKVCTLYLTIDDFMIVRKKGDFLELDLLLFTMGNIIEELFEKSYQAEVFQWGEYDFFIILNMNEHEAYESFAAIMDKKFHIFVTYARQYYGIEVSGGLSRAMTGNAGLKQALKEAEEILARRFFTESGHLHHYRPFAEKEINLPEEYQISVLKELAECHDFHGMKQFLNSLFSFLSEQGTWNPGKVRLLLRQVYRALAVALAGSGINVNNYMDHNNVDIEAAINDYSFLHGITQSVSEILEQCIDAFESNRGGTRRREIAEVKSFVKGHLKEEILLPEIASMVNMSASHFSHIFKKEEGISFMEYVYGLRMERAKSLLKNSDLKVNEIAEQIGIDNSNYFSAQFKKRTGQSPLEYRQAFLNNRKI